jgi:hypothetical protein
LLWPMSRMMKSVGMYVSWIFTKISLATPSGFHRDWSAIYSWKCAADKGPPSILSYVTMDMMLILAPRSQKALWKTCVSRNCPNYKSTSTKTITEVIKFSHLSSYNPGSPTKSWGISNQPTYKPRS